MGATQKDAKVARVAARVPEKVKTRWATAAALRGQTLTDFIIVAANSATAEVFSEQERIELSERDQLQLAQLLINPPALSPTMKKALEARMSELEAR